jgi:hypothetical protein
MRLLLLALTSRIICLSKNVPVRLVLQYLKFIIGANNLSLNINKDVSTGKGVSLALITGLVLAGTDKKKEQKERDHLFHGSGI